MHSQRADPNIQAPLGWIRTRHSPIAVCRGTLLLSIVAPSVCYPSTPYIQYCGPRACSRPAVPRLCLVPCLFFFFSPTQSAHYFMVSLLCFFVFSRVSLYIFLRCMGKICTPRVERTSRLGTRRHPLASRSGHHGAMVCAGLHMYLNGCSRPSSHLTRPRHVIKLPLGDAGLRQPLPPPPLLSGPFSQGVATGDQGRVFVMASLNLVG